METKEKDPLAVALGQRGGQRTALRYGRGHYIRCALISAEVRRSKSLTYKKKAELDAERVEVKLAEPQSTYHPL